MKRAQKKKIIEGGSPKRKKRDKAFKRVELEIKK